MKSNTCQALFLYDSEPLIQTWLYKQRASGLYSQELDSIHQHASGCFGYFSLQLGVSQHVDTLASFPIHKKLYLASTRPSAKNDNLLYSDPQYLPLEDDSCDLVVIHHLHELVDDPHQLIREAARVTRNEGSLFIIGTTPNPLRLLMRILPSRSTTQWQQRLMSYYRLQDWLRLVGFTKPQVYCHAHWMNRLSKQFAWSERFLQWAVKALNMSSFYCLKSSKRSTAPLIPFAQDNTNKAQSILGGRIAKPSATTKSSYLRCRYNDAS